jgi:hypothetical protein
MLGGRAATLLKINFKWRSTDLTEITQPNIDCAVFVKFVLAAPSCVAIKSDYRIWLMMSEVRNEGRNKA